MIHPTAAVDPTATLHPTAEVGAHSRIGPGCRLEAYAVVGPFTTLGPHCHVFSFAAVGGPAQDRKTAPDAPFRLICGARNVFREGSTVSRGTEHGGGETRLGDDNLLMAHSHMAHDNRIGDRCTLANGVSLAGHVELGDAVSLGGHAGVHQFARIGDLAFVAANAMISLDIPPYCLAAGDRAKLYGLNRVGLERAGLSSETRTALEAAFRLLFRTVGGRKRAEELLASPIPEVVNLARFVQATARGLTAARSQ